MGPDEEAEKLRQDIEKTKERILNINKNLQMELESYSKNRTENLRHIIGFSCHADAEMGRKISEFAASRQSHFPQTVEPTNEKAVDQVAEEEPTEVKKEEFNDIDPL